MATTFNWIYLGTSTTLLDPTEGNSDMENANLFVNQTYGSTTDPLYNHITSTTTIDNGGTAGALDTNNSVVNDQFTTNIGTGTQTYVYDGITVYNATVTYADGTTATITAVIIQSTTGELFLAPETVVNADTTLEEAKPIVSLRLDSVNASTAANMAADRAVTGWDDGWVEGTAGNDLINSTYVEPIANGTDKIDGGDGISSAGTAWQDDRVRAGAGNDTVLSGLGNDYVDGGSGADSIDGGSGNDSLFGGTGTFNDTILGGIGNDTIDGGDGIDSLLGGDGTDSILGGLGADYVDGGTEADYIDGGDGNDSLFGGSGTFNDTILGGLGADTIDGGDGDDSLLGGDGADSILGGAGNDTILFGAGDDTVLGGAGNDDIDDVANTGLVGNNLLDGGDGNDRIWAGLGTDTLIGGTGNDQLYGEEGNDTLNGGAGADTLIGGDGSDVFTGLTAGDVVIGSEDASGTDQDVLDLFGSGWSFATTNIIYSTPDKENGTVEFLDANGAVIGTMSFSNVESIIACFTPGTLIDTDKGPVLIERLAVGDRIRTRDHGYQTLRWIGRRDLSPSDLAAEPRLRPILIRAGAFGPAMPVRDMRLSPQHRLLLSGARAELYSGETEVLAPAQHFLGMAGVVQDAAMAGTSYIHLLFDRHEIVRSDGIWSESFQPAAALLSGLDRAQRDEVMALFPELFADLSPANDRHYPAARSTVKRHEARLILAS